jgi:hypothetical protein
MSDLFDIEPTIPPWKALADERGIATEFYNESWTASIEWWGETETETAETEKLAIEALTLRLKLNEKGNDDEI